MNIFVVEKYLIDGKKNKTESKTINTKNVRIVSKNLFIGMNKY
jgi:hypothetical protein